MKRFTYKAVEKKTGKTVKGSIQAESDLAAGKLLLAQGYSPMSVEEQKKGGLLSKFLNKVSTKDKITFTRQFATLIAAGLPLSNSLKVVAEQTSSKPMRAVIESVLAQVESGKTLAESFGKHPEVFDKVYLALIAAGEVSGTLDISLQRLATQQEKDSAMISKIRGALTYPAIVLVVIFVVLGFMLLVVVPQVKDLYDDLNKELPAITAFLTDVAFFLMNQWWSVLLAVVVFVVVFIQFKKTDMGIRWMAVFKLNVPLFKGLFQRLYMTRFARTMEMLLVSGVALLDSMKIAAEVMGNVVLQKEMEKASEKVQAGKPLSEGLKGCDYMMPLLPQMASIGEESGKIDEMLGKAAAVYEQELDERIAAISEMIEPILMLVMAGLVVVIVLAVLMPVYSLVNSI